MYCNEQTRVADVLISQLALQALFARLVYSRGKVRFTFRREEREKKLCYTITTFDEEQCLVTAVSDDRQFAIQFALEDLVGLRLVPDEYNRGSDFRLL